MKKEHEIGELSQDKLSFVHLPTELYENIAAEEPQVQSLITALRKLPLENSVPLVMQLVLNASIQDIADYHNISRQRVDKKNKSSLKILKTYLF